MFFRKIATTKISKDLYELLNDFTPEQYKIILESIEQYLPDNFVKLVDDIEEKVEIASEIIVDILYSLVAKYVSYFKSGESIEEYLKEEKEGEIKDFIGKLLNMDESFGIWSKVVYLSTENPNRHMDSTIITDLRPIYYEDPIIEPKYSLIKHTLKLTLSHGGKIRELYITMERDDLEVISKLIDRALKKENALEKVCKDKDIKVFRGLRIIGDE